MENIKGGGEGRREYSHSDPPPPPLFTNLPPLPRGPDQSATIPDVFQGGCFVGGSMEDPGRRGGEKGKTMLSLHVNPPTGPLFPSLLPSLYANISRLSKSRHTHFPKPPPPPPSEKKSRKKNYFMENEE